MGDCNCCSFDPWAKINIKPNEWIVFQIYGGCSRCQQPAGVIVYQMSSKELLEWGADEIGDLSFNSNEAFIPIVDFDEIKKEVASELSAGLIDYLDDNILKEAIDQTLEKHIKNG